MTDQELIAALRRNMAETGSLRCLGCGHEHGCSTHGCAVLRQAAERIERLGEQQDDNPPLTLEELRRMDGEPVWIEPVQQWRIVHIDCDGEFVGLHTEFDIISAKGVLNDDGRIYRRKPEEARQHEIQ